MLRTPGPSFSNGSQLAERAGLMHSVPKLGDLFEPGMKQERRLARKLKKVSEKLVDELRPS